ncbi:MAG: hypothetical protein GY801_15020 [bacterium]|nr:hypothetical protein [bacterium]
MRGKFICINRIVLLTLLVSMPGLRGTAQPPQGEPPQEALDACIDKLQGEVCEIETPHRTMTGTCMMPPQGEQFVCVPEGGPPGGPPSGPPGASGTGRMPQPQRFASASSGVTEPDVRFAHLTMEDGLSNNFIETILQDRLGFMWIGTQDGLNRYDGYEFIVYKPESGNPHSLSHSHVMDLFEDKEGMIWVTTKGGGVNRLDPSTGRFTRYSSDPDNPNSLGGNTVFSIFQDSSGHLWFGGLPETGLNKLVLSGAEGADPTTETFTRYFPDTIDPEGFPGAGVWEIIEDEAPPGDVQRPGREPVDRH